MSEWEMELPRSPQAPAIARSAVVERCRGHLDEDELFRARLLVSELVTNAFTHGRGRITLRGRLDDDRLYVEVIDEGGGFEHELRVASFDSIGGRGLQIVDLESSRWGVHEGTTHVWFELERTGPRLGADQKPELPDEAD